MSAIPDWLVERAALDEVPAASRDRIARADSRALADRISALREDDARELAQHPAGPAVAQIEARVAAERQRQRMQRRRGRWTVLGVAATALAVLIVVRVADESPPADRHAIAEPDDGIRAKGNARLLAFRQVGDQVEQLAQDTLVRAGDVIQLRYNAGGQRYGVIASIDGAGTVTLHYPATEDAPPEATAVAADTTSLPHAYALDDAPRFERFFFVTANRPIDVPAMVISLRAFAQRDDSADAALALPPGLRQASLRLRKPDTRPEAP